MKTLLKIFQILMTIQYITSNDFSIASLHKIHICITKNKTLQLRFLPLKVFLKQIQCKKSLKLPKVGSEDVKGGIRRYQRWDQKIPTMGADDTKGEIRRYQRWDQKIPKVRSEVTKGGIRRYQRWDQKIPKVGSEALNSNKDR